MEDADGASNQNSIPNSVFNQRIASDTLSFGISI